MLLNIVLNICICEYVVGLYVIGSEVFYCGRVLGRIRDSLCV